MFRYGRWFTLILALSALPAAAVTLEQVNRTTIAAPMDANGDSMAPMHVSRDGRYALFISEAANLVAGDTNDVADLFLYDAVADQVERINLGSGGTQSNESISGAVAVTADGRWVFFTSNALDLVPGAVLHPAQIYLRDRATGTTTLLIRGGDGLPLSDSMYLADASEDGRYVLLSTAAALLPVDTNQAPDLYRLDRNTGDYHLVSVASDGSAAGADWDAQLSANGRYAVFSSWAGNLVAGDTNDNVDLFWRDLDQGRTVRIAENAPYGSPNSIGAPALPWGRNALSDDGRYVLFSTWQALLPADTNGLADGYRFDSGDGSLQRVTLDGEGAQFGNVSQLGGLSADGTSLLFMTAWPLLPSDPVPAQRAYWRDIAGGQIANVPLHAGPDGREGEVRGCTASPDAGIAYCLSTTQRLFGSEERGFLGLFRAVRGDGSVRRVSRSAGAAVAYANGHSGRHRIAASDDGRYVVFDSQASNLVVGDNNGVSDVFLHDRLLGSMTRLSVDAQGAESACASEYADLSPDGRYVVFERCGPAGSANDGFTQIYRLDRLTGQSLLVSTDYKATPGDAASTQPRISDDGNVILFRSVAQNLGVPAHASGDYFLRDVAAATTTIVSHNPQTGQSDGIPYSAWLSGDGRFVAFDDSSTDLVDGDTNSGVDVFVFDRGTRQIERVSTFAQGEQLGGSSFCLGFSRDGTQVLFTTFATVPGFPSGITNLFVRDRLSGALEFVSRGNYGTAAPGIIDQVAVSADGRRVAFGVWSGAWYDQFQGLFVFDRAVQRTYRITAQSANRAILLPQFVGDADRLVFASESTNLLGGIDGNGHFRDVFIAAGVNDAIFSSDFADLPF